MEQKMMLSYGSLQIPCVLNAPDEEEVRRIVLGVHGLGGCTTDEIQSNLAEEMVFFEIDSELMKNQNQNSGL